ncbi:MAG: 30S ribosomal protein S3, partial [Methylocystis sp.]
ILEHDPMAQDKKAAEQAAGGDHGDRDRGGDRRRREPREPRDAA